MEVTFTMSYSGKNRAALDKNEQLVKKHYSEPEDCKFKDPFSHFMNSKVGVAGEKYNIGWYKN